MFGQWQLKIPESQECETEKKDEITTDNVTKYSSNSVTKEDTQTDTTQGCKDGYNVEKKGCVEIFWLF